MTIVQVIVTDLGTDLLPFSQLLWQRDIAHRIHEQAGRQILSVEGDQAARLVMALYRDFQAGKIAPVQNTTSPRQRSPATWRRWLSLAPVTLLLVLGCVLGALVVASGRYEWLRWLNIQDWLRLLTIQDWSGTVPGRLVDALQQGQWWRLWTPIFLHFGLLHLVFNGLWLWEFGRRIELLQGHGRLLGLVALLGLGSNLAQYAVTDATLFGGMSGVVCGLVGYCWGWSLVRPGQDFGMPRAVYWVFLGMIVLLWLVGGAFSSLGFPSVADAAHFSGMLLGLGAGASLAYSTPGPADRYRS